MLAPQALTPTIRPARPDEMNAVRALFRTYLDYIGAPECFPSFEAELASLPGRYAPPTGTILLACVGPEIAAVVALRAFPEPPAPSAQGFAGAPLCASGEVKRLFVLPAFHGQGLGRLLMDALIAHARAVPFHRLLLDTIPGRMDPAIALYRSLGFQPIERYYDDPIPGVEYFELVLHSDAS